MRTVVFSGTTEGRVFSRQLAAMGAEVLVSVATPLGAEEQGEMAGITVCCGRLEPDAMVALLRNADLCVDATHPYAVEATRNIRSACGQAGVEYHRLLRPASPLPAGSAVFAGIDPNRLFPRVLPTVEGITACEKANIPHRNIIAMQGPFSYALNAALLQQFHIQFMVTKDGGAAGGFAEKVQAAQVSGVQLVVIRRPEEQGETAEEILRRCKERLA